MPVAYIIGSWWFYGREFLVTQDVLVPRPETERLIEDAITYVRSRAAGVPPRVLDVGTGSGAIACTMAVEIADALVNATEISAKALAVARQNAQRLGVSNRCTFFEGDLTQPVSRERYDCVIANLPYVPTAQLPPAPDPVSFEPAIAVDGGVDGLDVYRRLLPQLPRLLNSDALVLLEAAPATVKGLRDLASEAFTSAGVAIVRDYAGLERYVRIADPQGPPGDLAE